MQLEAEKPRGRWVHDPHLTYVETLKRHPNCRISVEQTEPEQIDLLIDEPAPPALADVMQLVREKRVAGFEATYCWSLWDRSNPLWARGRFRFAAGAADPVCL